MKTVQDLGGPTVVSRIVGLAVPTVHGWKRIPEWHCPAIEKAKRTEGVDISVEDMRPDIVWARVKDKTWPHPKGRPAIDPSATQARTVDTPAKAEA